MRKSKSGSGFGVALGAMVLALALVAGGGFAVYQWRFAPSKTKMALTEYFILSGAEDCAVILNGEYLTPETEDGSESACAYARVNGNTLYLELSFVKKQLDDGYVYDPEAAELRYCTDRALVQARSGESSWTEGGDMRSAAAAAVTESGGQVWLLADFVSAYTDASFDLHTDDPARVVIETAGLQKTTAVLEKEEAARRYGGIKSDVLTTVPAGAEVMVLEDYGDWAKVLTPDAVIGCVRTSLLKDQSEVTVQPRLQPRSDSHHLLDVPVVAGWHQVLSYGANANVSSLLDGTNVNVVIPTWFLMNDDFGGIQSFAESSYVQTCHSRGVQVWGLVSNIQYKVNTEGILNSSAARDNLVNRLMEEAAASGIDGINVDLETIPPAAKDGYIQLIRELSLRCEAAGLILSVDNYVPTAYTAFYNREEQAKYIDYHIIMAYDEHYGGGEEGSGASYPFVRNAAEAVLETTPAEQIILGVPFYTRIWTTDSEGNTTSTTLIIAEENNLLSSIGRSWNDAQWLDEERQFFIEYENGNGVNHIWLEEQDSISAKISVAREYGLAGVCFWRLGQEPKNMWSTIEAALGQ